MQLKRFIFGCVALLLIYSFCVCFLLRNADDVYAQDTTGDDPLHSLVKNVRNFLTKKKYREALELAKEAIHEYQAVVNERYERPGQGGRRFSPSDLFQYAELHCMAAQAAFSMQVEGADLKMVANEYLMKCTLEDCLNCARDYLRSYLEYPPDENRQRAHALLALLDEAFGERKCSPSEKLDSQKSVEVYLEKLEAYIAVRKSLREFRF